MVGYEKLNGALCDNVNALNKMCILYEMCTGSVEITNKMQPCNRIYYSKVYWRLSTFRAAQRSSSGAL